MQPPQQQTPFPLEQQTELAIVPETKSGKDLAGIQPTQLIGSSPIEHAVYRSDIDPAYSELFEPVQGSRKTKPRGMTQSAKNRLESRKLIPWTKWRER